MQKLKNNEAWPKFTGSYLKKSVYNNYTINLRRKVLAVIIKLSLFKHCDLKLILDTKAFLTATVNCTLCYRLQCITEHADQRDSLALQTLCSYLKVKHFFIN